MNQRYSAGDVVNLLCPNQENQNQATFRPVLIAEDLGNDIIIVFMTKQIDQQKNYPNSFVVLKNSPAGLLMGLTFDTLICPSRIQEVRKAIIYPPKRGKCPTNILEKVLEYIS